MQRLRNQTSNGKPSRTAPPAASTSTSNHEQTLKQAA
jgi:hypothetical protein